MKRKPVVIIEEQEVGDSKQQKAPEVGFIGCLLFVLIGFFFGYLAGH